MKASTTEREREIEANIAAREHEIAALEQEKNELQAGMTATNPDIREDALLAQFPVLDYCGRRPREPIRNIPVEQYGNLMIQLDIAQKAIDVQNQKDRSEMYELRTLIREQEKQSKAMTEKTKKLAEAAGIDLKSLTDRRREELMILNDYQSHVPLEDLEARTRLVEHEVRAAKIISEKKSAAILALTAMVEKRRVTIDEVDAMYNEIRIIDRDMTLASEEVAQRSIEMEDANAWLEARPNPADSVVRKVVDEDSFEIKGLREQTVKEQRIPQERIIKAQDYRIAHLERRAKLIDRSLKNNGLSRKVNKYVTRGWSKRDLEVPEDHDELYDIERIIPAQEKVHPGVYNLLLTEKEKTSRTVSILTISAKEKEEVIASLATQLEKLAAECNAAIEQLDSYASEAAFAEERQRIEALEWVQKQREHCKELSKKKAGLENAVQTSR